MQIRRPFWGTNFCARVQHRLNATQPAEEPEHKTFSVNDATGETVLMIPILFLLLFRASNKVKSRQTNIYNFQYNNKYI